MKRFGDLLPCVIEEAALSVRDESAKLCMAVSLCALSLTT